MAKDLTEEEVLKAEKKRAELKKEIAVAVGDEKKELELQLKLIENSLDLFKEMLGTQLDILKARVRANDAHQLEVDLFEKSKEIREATEVLEEKLAKHRVAGTDASREDVEVAANKVVELEKQRDLQRDAKDALEESANLGATLFDSIASISTPLLKNANTLAQTEGAMKGISTALGTQMKGFLEQAGNLDPIIFGVDLLWQNTKDLVMQLDSLEAGFVQSTGASREFATEAFQTRTELVAVGLSGADAAEAAGELYTNFRDFTKLSETSRKEVIKLTAQLTKLGFQASQTLEILTNVLNMPLGKAEDTMLHLAGVADEAGISMDELSSAMQGSTELFAKMGTDGIEVFKGLTAASKETGLGIDQLFNTMAQYDTFDAAASAASRLNMVLGGNLLNTYDLLAADEAERIELLQRSMEASGVYYDDLERYQRIEISNALNISLEESARLFSSTSEEVRKTAAQIMHANMTEEELRDRTLEASTAIDKLKVFFGNLAIGISGVVTAMNWFIDTTLRLTSGWNPVVTGIAGVTAVLIILKATLWATGKALGTGLAAGIKAAAAALPSLGAGLSALAGATAPTLGVLAGLALVILAVGAGIGIAAWGVSKLVESIGGIIELGPGAAGAFFKISAGIAVMTLAIGGLMAGLFLLATPIGQAGLYALVTLVAILGIAFHLLSRQMEKLDEGKLNAFASLATTLKDLSGGFGDMTAIGNFIDTLVTKINDIEDIDKLLSFQAVVSGISSAMKDIEDLNPETLTTNVEAITTLTNATAGNVTTAAAGASAAAADRTVATTTSAVEVIMGTFLDSIQGSSVSDKIVIELNGRVLGEWMDKRDNRLLRKVFVR